MANPKRRFSKSRTRRRRSIAMRLHTVHATDCPRCHQPKLPHRICPNCGHYAGREVLPAAE